MNGRIRGLVVGDLLRRVVSRSIAQHYGKTIHTACSPYQFALSTRAGTEAVVHALTATTQLSPTQTIFSVDGVGAYDTISRASMLRGLHATAGANACLPFVRMFYTETSHYVWHDGDGQPHMVTQDEGGEQGDPLMPALFSLGQHQALQAAHEQLQAGETLCAFLDDIYVTVSSERVRPVYQSINQSNLHARGQPIWAQVIVGNRPHMYNTVQTPRATSDSQCRRQRQRQPCMPHWAACFRHRREIVKLHPIYINTCKTSKIQAGLNAKGQHQLQRPPMKVNSSSGKNL